MVALRKYQLFLLSIAFGLLMAAAWPERGLSFLAFIAWIPMLWLQDYIFRNPNLFGRNAIVLFAFPGFLIWNVLTTFWIYNSTDIGSILAFVLNSIFMSITFGVWHFVRRNVFFKGFGYFALPAIWISFEYLHQDWDLTWSWLNLGNVFASDYQWIQWYEFTGSFGGAIWIFAANIVGWHALKKWIYERNIKASVFRLIPFILLIFIPLIISLISYHNYQPQGKTAEIVVVQPDIDPYNEEYSTPIPQLLNNMLTLARQKTDAEVDMVLFPESSIAYTMWEADFPLTSVYDSMQRFVETYQTSIVMGLSTRVLFPEGAEIDAAAKVLNNGEGYFANYNTAAFIDAFGKWDFYHKAKLVPGVERMPFPRLLKPLESMAIDLGGATGSLGTSKDRSVFQFKDVKLGPIICYESIYGEFVTGYVRNGANLLGIITNDGWWGNTPGHRQHYEYARLRAIETRRDVARSANTGISGFFNQRGDDQQATEYWEPDVCRATVNLNESKTFYVVYGDYIARLSGFLSALLLLMALSFRLRKKRSI